MSAAELMFGNANGLTRVRRDLAALSRNVTTVLQHMDANGSVTPAQIAGWTKIPIEDVEQALMALEVVALVRPTHYERTQAGAAAIGNEGMTD